LIALILLPKFLNISLQSIEASLRAQRAKLDANAARLRVPVTTTEDSEPPEPTPVTRKQRATPSTAPEHSVSAGSPSPAREGASAPANPLERLRKAVAEKLLYPSRPCPHVQRVQPRKVRRNHRAMNVPGWICFRKGRTAASTQTLHGRRRAS
jgi:hypothetical protein